MGYDREYCIKQYDVYIADDQGDHGGCLLHHSRIALLVR